MSSWCCVMGARESGGHVPRGEGDGAWGQGAPCPSGKGASAFGERMAEGETRWWCGVTGAKESCGPVPGRQGEGGVPSGRQGGGRGRGEREAMRLGPTAAAMCLVGKVRAGEGGGICPGRDMGRDTGRAECTRDHAIGATVAEPCAMRTRGALRAGRSGRVQTWEREEGDGGGEEVARGAAHLGKAPEAGKAGMCLEGKGRGQGR